MTQCAMLFLVMNVLNEIENVRITSIYESPASKHAYTRSRQTHALVFKLSGESTYQFETGSLVHSQGEILFIPQGEAFSIEQTSHGESRFIVVNFTAALPSSSPKLFHGIEGADQSFIRMAGFWLFGERSKQLECYAVFYHLLADMLAHEQLDYKTSYQKNLIAPGMALLEKNIFSCDLKITEIIEVTGISEPYFRKIFHAVYGVTPKNYIQNKRLTRARDILEGGDCSAIQTVAQSVGFDDPLYFSRVFRAKYGLSPTEYLRNVRHR